MLPFAEAIDGRLGLGWCPKHPTAHIPPTLIPVPQITMEARGPAAGSRVGTFGRMRAGIEIAADSIRSAVMDRHLLWFSCFAALVMLAIIAGETMIILNSGNESALPFLLALPPWTGLHLLDIRIFLLQLVCLSGLTFIMAALIQYRFCKGSGKILTIRDAFSAVSTHTITLASLSLLMSLVGTVLYALVTQSLVFGKIGAGISTTLFYLPYAYYFPNLFDSAIWFSAILMAVAIIEFLVVMYVVPSVVLGNRDLVSAFRRSWTCIGKTWREMLGCTIVFGSIALGVMLIALAIGQSPLLLNHDYDFFLQISRGKILMTAACYGFVLTCGILAALGSTVFGVAVTRLYAVFTETSDSA